ncbi:hypothetical protein SAMN04488096_1156 [Mesonia phycicola]|uniref:Uncharacterized protein n=1 Tax=Mesonia phycicola TaxID=579105 RepID=A0A1M6HMW9_9FLAO|nr:hypothetical protein [Mesonia phycicola]SHJ23532.1 hypothetical protein SAMN04488096_1156 [Mesonia phycicola]|tara:strand:+ start:5795 stop:6769 length:975 start_codon:yes stop_codon:yes gene_type:complete
MNSKFLLTFFTLISGLSVFGQFSRENISTDSSDIEIIRNSVYHVYEESYKNKDSVWYSVHYIKDTTRLNTEGWKRKNGKHLGIWKEYNFDKQLLFTRDYDNAICEVNRQLFPHHEILERMKKKADSLIISNYSQEFFDSQVRFNFNCYAYDNDGYVGSWTEPMKRKPTEFLFRYQVRLKNSDWQSEMIGISLDENGNYIPSHDRFNNNGFEKLNSENRTFEIDKTKAISIAKEHGLKGKNISEFLKWERFNKATFYDGQFKYYIAELIDQIDEIKKEGRSRITYKFNVYSFNPWTGKFLGKKKMKQIKEWGKNSGFTSDLLPDE